jgi:hypothetical protein
VYGEVPLALHFDEPVQYRAGADEHVTALALIVQEDVMTAMAEGETSVVGEAAVEGFVRLVGVHFFEALRADPEWSTAIDFGRL